MAIEAAPKLVVKMMVLAASNGVNWVSLHVGR